MSQPNWQPVDSLPADGLMHTLESAISQLDLATERFESDGGEFARLLPLGPLAEGEVPGVVVTDAPPDAAEVLFIDPAEADSAVSLLTTLGRRAQTVRVRFPASRVRPGLFPTLAT